MRRACILGYGFLGRHLAENLLADGVALTVFDRKERPAHLDPGVRWHRGDFTRRQDYSPVVSDADCVFHLVSTTVPGDSDIGMLEEIHQNIEATVRLIDDCVASAVPRFVFASSASVYGHQRTLPIKETAATNPISVHGIQKLTIEKYMLMAGRLGRLETCIARIANPYGEYQDLGGRQGFVGIAIGHLLAGRPITVRAPDRTLRDYVHADDVARALHRLATSTDAVVVNVGSGEARGLAEVIGTLSKALGREARIEEMPARAADIQKSCLDIGLLRALDAAPHIGFEEGLARVARHHARRYTT